MIPAYSGELHSHAVIIYMHAVKNMECSAGRRRVNGGFDVTAIDKLLVSVCVCVEKVGRAAI